MKIELITGNLTTSATQSVGYTSANGTPKTALVWVYSVLDDTETQNDIGMSMGFYDGTNSVSSFTWCGGGSGNDAQRGRDTAFSIRLEDDTPTTLARGVLSFDTVNNEIDFDFSGGTTPTSTYEYAVIVFFGDDVSAAAVAHDGTDQTETLGFQPKLILTGGASTTSATTNNGAFTFGACDGTNQSCLRMGQDEGVNAQFACFSEGDANRNMFTTTLFGRIQFDTFTSTGMNINFTGENGDSDEPGIYLALTFDNDCEVIEAVDLTASTGTQAVTTTFEPDYLFGCGAVGITASDTAYSDVAGANYSHGFADLSGGVGASGVYHSSYFSKDRRAGNAFWRQKVDETDFIRALDGNTGGATDDMFGDVSAKSGTSFTINKSDADTAARFFFVAIGAASAGDTEVPDSATDSIATSDTATPVAEQANSGTDTVLTVDTALEEALVSDGGTSSVAVADTAGELALVDETGASALATSETVVVDTTWSPSLEDTVTVGDSLSGIDTVSAEDSVAVTDSSTEVMLVTDGGTDSVAVTDTVNDLPLTEAQALDSVGVSDGLELGFIEEVSDSIATTDTASGASEGTEFSPVWWGKRKEVDLDTSFVVGSSKTNFPMLVKITDTDVLEQTRSDYRDLVITDENDNPIPMEIEYADANAVYVWVKVPALVAQTPLSASDTVAVSDSVDVVGGTFGETLADSVAITDPVRSNPAVETVVSTVQVSDSIPGGTASSISRHGITWTFDQEYTAGQYANGDWWVVGPVNVTGITPASTLNSGRYMHGSMKNLQPRSSVQGFDSISYFEYGDTYDHTENIGFGVSSGSPLTLQPGDAMISVESMDSVGTSTNGHSGIFKTAAVLTIVSAPQADGAFRPPYCTATDTPYSTAQLNLSKLTSTFPISGSTTSLSEKYVAAMADGRLQLQYLNNWKSQFTHPIDNMRDYGRELINSMSEMHLMMHSDLTLEQKTPILYGLIQAGIDWDGLYAKNMNWPADGGHSHGRKWPIMFKRAMFDENPDLGNTPSQFQEDDQTHYVAETSPGVYNFGYGGYNSSHVGMPEWAFRHYTANPQGSQNYASFTQDAYRTCCTARVWFATQLCAYVMGLRGAWGHEAFFDYLDRYKQSSGASVGFGSYTWPVDMWNTYRSTFTSYPVPALNPNWPQG